MPHNDKRSGSLWPRLLWVVVLAIAPQCAAQHPDSNAGLPESGRSAPAADTVPQGGTEDWISLLQPVVKIDDPDETTGFAFYLEDTDKVGSPVWNEAATIEFVVTSRLGDVLSKYSLKRTAGIGGNDVPSPALLGGFSAHSLGFVFRLRVKPPPGQPVWMPAAESWVLMPKRAGEEPRVIDVTSEYVVPTGLQYLGVVGASAFFDAPLFLVSRVVSTLGTQSYGFCHDILGTNGRRLWSIEFPNTIQGAKSYGYALIEIAARPTPVSQIIYPSTIRLLEDLDGHYSMFAVAQTSDGVIVRPVTSFVED